MTQPSAHYTELLEYYRTLHEKGDVETGKTAEYTFSGISLIPQIVRVRELIQKSGAQTLLDYGCGKGMLYRLRPLRVGPEHVYPSLQEFWGAREITLYDPAYAPHAQKPAGAFDGVLCTDVLEHCASEDIAWILAELFGYAQRFVFATVACYPSRKLLPNGENAHCTVRPVDWWEDAIRTAAASNPACGFTFILSYKEQGTIMETVFEKN